MKKHRGNSERGPKELDTAKRNGGPPVEAEGGEGDGALFAEGQEDTGPLSEEEKERFRLDEEASDEDQQLPDGYNAAGEQHQDPRPSASEKPNSHGARWGERSPGGSRRRR